MRTLAEYTISLPNWAICPLVNADSSEITEEEDQMLLAWERETLEEYPEGSYACYDISEESSFTPYPELGLACDCHETKVTIFNNSQTVSVWDESVTLY
jgi:hypothetical protein